MYQSGYLESEIWEDGFIDPHIWYTLLGLPSIVTGTYDAVALTITATGDNFFTFKGTGELYYRKDSGAWTPMPTYLSWNNNTIVGKLVAVLDYGNYDLKLVRSDSEEATLIPAFVVSPLLPSEYYADFNAVATGTGTEADPWNLDQVKSYYNKEAGYFPVDGDILNVKGDIAPETVDAYLFQVNIGDSITITMRGWDKATNGMYTISTPNSGLDVFRILSGSSDVTLDIQDMVLLPTDTAGSSPADLVLVKTLDNTVDINKIILRDCMIISEEDLHVVSDDGSHKTDVSIYGSNISIGDATFYLNDYADISSIFDSAINLQGTAAINDAGGSINWDHCEFNTTSTPIPGVMADCTFENEKLELLPTVITAAAFYENDFNYMIYDLQNAGSGSIFWSANSMTTDIKGAPRLGIGAFRFEAYNYYVDGSKSISGIGTQVDQFTLNQLRNYFDSSLGDLCGVSPTGFDTFLLKNIFVPIDNFFIYVNNIIGGYVTIKAADIGADKAWFIETKESS